MFKDTFKLYVEQGVNNYFVGTGNPNAKILFIGKESAISSDDINGKLWYSNNANDWNKHIASNTCEIFEYFVDENHVLRNGWGKNTWSKYQKLSDIIWKQETKPFYIDFLKYTFTTELNDSPEKNTATANKSGLNERKLLFKKSEFIQGFPVVVLACSDYIKNNAELREIDEIFNVTYNGDETGRYWYNKGNWFYIHHNEDRTKLVIHTRQLSADVKNEMLECMGAIIREHLIKIGIIESINCK